MTCLLPFAPQALSQSKSPPPLSWRPQVRFQRCIPETLASGSKVHLWACRSNPSCCLEVHGFPPHQNQTSGASEKLLSPSPGSNGAHNAPHVQLQSCQQLH